MELSPVWAPGLSLCCVVPGALLTHQMPQVSAPNFWGSWGKNTEVVWGEGGDRGWDVWMASPTQWTWLWENSGRWWRTGKPGVLRSMGSQRVRYGWAAEQHLVPTVLLHWLLAMRLMLLCARRAGMGKQSCEETWVNTSWECTGHGANFSSRVSQVPHVRAKSLGVSTGASASPGVAAGCRPPRSPAGSQAWETPVGSLHGRVTAESSYAVTGWRSWEPGWMGYKCGSSWPRFRWWGD